MPGTWGRLTKPQLNGVDEWSHWEHGPGNNPVSTDEVIKALTLGSGAVLVPNDRLGEVERVLNDCKAEYVKTDVWLPA